MKMLHKHTARFHLHGADMTFPNDRSPTADDEPALPDLPDLPQNEVADDEQVKGGLITYSGHAGLGANVVAPPPRGTTGST